MKVRQISNNEFQIEAECDCEAKRLTDFVRIMGAEARKRMKKERKN